MTNGQSDRPDANDRIRENTSLSISVSSLWLGNKFGFIKKHSAGSVAYLAQVPVAVAFCYLQQVIFTRWHMNRELVHENRALTADDQAQPGEEEHQPRCRVPHVTKNYKFQSPILSHLQQTCIKIIQETHGDPHLLYIGYRNSPSRGGTLKQVAIVRENRSKVLG